MAFVKFSAAAISALIAAIEDGQTAKQACATSGISQAVFHVWMRDGANGDPVKAAFRERILDAMTARAQRQLETVLAGLHTDAAAPIAAGKETETPAEARRRRRLAAGNGRITA